MTLERYEDDVSGKVAADGTALLRWGGLRGTYGSLLMIASAPGTPRWTVVKSGAKIAAGAGAVAPLELPMIKPQEPLEIGLVGGIPGQAVTVHIIGYHSDSPLDLPITTPRATVLALDTTPALTPITTETLPTAATITKTYQLPAGNNSLIFYRELIGSSPTTLQISVTGVASGRSYGFTTNSTEGVPQVAQITDPRDLAPAGGGVTVVYSLGALGTGAKVDVTANQMPLSVPLPWQAPDKIVDVSASGSLANGTSIALAPAVAGQTVRLFGVHLGYDIVSSQMTIESSVTGAVLWRGTYNNTAALTGNSNFESQENGAPAPVGEGLVLFNRSGGVRSVFGSVGISQA